MKESYYRVFGVRHSLALKTLAKATPVELELDVSRELCTSVREVVSALPHLALLQLEDEAL